MENLKTFVIIYECIHNNMNYRFEELIRSCPAYGRLTSSSWIIMSKNDATTIHKKLRRYLHEDDRLIVIECSNKACWANMIMDRYNLIDFFRTDKSND